MLVLTRRKGESIAIGDNIQIQVLSVKGGQVRIGVNAPREVSVNREERIIDLVVPLNQGAVQQN